MNFGKGEYIGLNPPVAVIESKYQKEPFFQWINNQAKKGNFFCGTAPVENSGGVVAIFWRPEL